MGAVKQIASAREYRRIHEDYAKRLTSLIQKAVNEMEILDKAQWEELLTKYRSLWMNEVHKCQVKNKPDIIKKESFDVHVKPEINKLKTRRAVRLGFCEEVLLELGFSKVSEKNNSQKSTYISNELLVNLVEEDVIITINGHDKPIINQQGYPIESFYYLLRALGISAVTRYQEPPGFWSRLFSKIKSIFN